MTQQLWYTWSAIGLGQSHGLYVRTASIDLSQVEEYLQFVLECFAKGIGLLKKAVNEANIPKTQKWIFS